MAMSPGMPAIVVGWMSSAEGTLDRVVEVDTPGSAACAIAGLVASTRTKAVAASTQTITVERALLSSALLPMARAFEQGDDSREICRQSRAHVVTSDDI